MRTLILTGDDVRSVLTPEAAVDAVQTAFEAHGRGQTRMPPKLYLGLPEYDGDFRAMPASMDGRAGVKWINAHPENPARYGLPAVIGVYVYSDPASAAPLAIMDATAMTAMRTGAAAAVATRVLARNGATSLGIIGCGAQARSVIECHRRVMAIAQLLLHDRSDTAVDALRRQFPDVPCRAASLQETAACDVVCTLTPSRAPLVQRAMVRTGAHINAMGADAPGKQELAPDILRCARVFLDDRVQAMESGEVNVPLREGILRESDIAGTLGELIARTVEGRRADDITVFDSTGLAVQDLAVAAVVYERARERRLGLEIELIRP